MKDVVSRIFVGSLSCLIALSNNAVASEKGTFSSSIGARVTYDDNLYKINKESEQIRLLLPDFNFTDTINTVFANGGMDWDISKQKLLASVSVSENKFSKNSQLDNTAVNYKAKWNWHLNRLLSGNIGYSKDRQLVNFTDNLNAALLASKIDNDLAEFLLNWRLHNRWQALLGLNERTTEYSVDALALNNKSVVTSQVKLIYESEARNTISVSFKRENIDYQNRIFEVGNNTDNKYRLSTIILGTSYNFTDKSYLTTRLIWREIDPMHLSSARKFDISDWGYIVNYRWQPTATIRLSTSVADEISPSENANTDFQRSQVYELGITWQALNKVFIGFQTAYRKRQYEYNRVGSIGLDFAPENTYRTTSIKATYIPSNIFELQFGFEFKNQRSDLLIRNFDSNTTYASLIAKF